MLQLIGATLQLILLILSKWVETDKEKRENKGKLQGDLEDAIAKQDTSAIVATIDSINRLR